MPLITPSLAGSSAYWSVFMPLVKNINQVFSPPRKRTCFLSRREPMPAAVVVVVVVVVVAKGEVPVHNMTAHGEVDV